MGSRRFATALVGACLLAAATAHAGAAWNGTQRLPIKTLVLVHGGTTLTATQQVELQQLPAKEIRHRLDTVLAAHPDDVVARLFRADAEVELGDGAAALHDIDPVMDAFGPETRAILHEVRGEALMLLGRDAEALVDGEAAVGADPDDPTARVVRGWALYTTGKDLVQALGDLDTALASQPDNAVALIRRSIVRAARQDLDAGLADAKRAVELAPRDGGMRAVLANAQLALGHLDQAREQVEQAIRLAPDTAVAWIVLTQLDLMQGRVEATIADAARALALHAPPTEQAVVYLARATAWGMKGDPAKMLADLDKGAALDPTRVEFMKVRAAWDIDHQDWHGAKASLDRALQVAPQCAECLAQRAFVEASLGERAAALKDGDASLAMAPAAASVHRLYADALAALHEPARAIREFDKALAIDRDDIDAWFHRATARHDVGDDAGAIEDLGQVLERSPPALRAPVLMLRGAALDGAGELDRAARDFAEAATLQPDNAQAHRFIGRVREQRGDFAGAADAFAKSLAIEPDEAAAYSLGRMRMFSGRFGDAPEPFRVALRIGKNPSAYAPMWIYLSRLRADAADEADARKELLRLAPVHEPRAWADSLVDFVLGRIDAETLRRRAGDAPDDKRVGQRCEADYYAAETELAHGRRAPALPLLANAVKVCPTTFFEAFAAQAELRLQGVQP
jgi:tetratricopeptide (TPR) repeat protein